MCCSQFMFACFKKLPYTYVVHFDFFSTFNSLSLGLTPFILVLGRETQEVQDRPGPNTELQPSWSYKEILSQNTLGNRNVG